MTYVENLAKWVREREEKRPRQDQSLVAFLAARQDVVDAMEAGYSLKTIWENLHETGRIRVRYDTFLKHVRRHIRASQKTHPPKAKPSSAPAVTPRSDPADASPAPQKSGSIRGFEFNPTADKQELI